MRNVSIITLFPEMISNYCDQSILGRAHENGLISIRLHQLRDFAEGKHRVTDEPPYGGGGGMVMKPAPFASALTELNPQGPVISLTPRGRPFDHETAVRLALESEITLLCGRYKGIDERVTERWVDEEISIGDYVLSGGEPAALVVIDAVVRLLPGALGDHDSAASDSFYEGLLAAPAFTRPAEHEGRSVPDVLRSGDHPRIERWRAEQAERATRARRPDLLDLDASD